MYGLTGGFEEVLRDDVDLNGKLTSHVVAWTSSSGSYRAFLGIGEIGKCVFRVGEAAGEPNYEEGRIMVDDLCV